MLHKLLVAVITTIVTVHNGNHCIKLPHCHLNTFLVSLPLVECLIDCFKNCKLVQITGVVSIPLLQIDHEGDRDFACWESLFKTTQTLLVLLTWLGQCRGTTLDANLSQIRLELHQINLVYVARIPILLLKDIRLCKAQFTHVWTQSTSEVGLTDVLSCDVLLEMAEDLV